MMQNIIYICAIPEEYWHPSSQFQLGLPKFHQDIKSIERRISKQVNLQDEFNRYTLVCQRLEQEILESGKIRQVSNPQGFAETVQQSFFPMIAIGGDYLKALIGFIELEDFSHGTVFSPDELETHYQAFSDICERHSISDSVINHKLKFMRIAIQNKCGIVEIQSGFHAAKKNGSTDSVLDSLIHQEENESANYIEIPDFVRAGLEVEHFGKRKLELANELRKQILDGLRNDEPVNLGSTAPHDVITEVLNEFVFVSDPTELKPANLRVMYVDGSEATPFPVFCLLRTQTQDSNFRLRVALMSMRHLEMDPDIDYCWFRNREVSRTRTLAETDQFCFETTISQLDEILDSSSIELNIYHTGFEPAVVGFYRGLVHKLRQSSSHNSVVVIPQYYRGQKGYQPGKIWQTVR